MTSGHAWANWLAAQDKRLAEQSKRTDRVADLHRQRQLDVQELAIMRRLLSEERALRRGGASPWTCSASGCPFQGKPMNKHCRCYTEAVAAHDKAVARKLAAADED